MPGRRSLNCLDLVYQILVYQATASRSESDRSTEDRTMSALTDAAYAYRRQRADVQLVGESDLRRAYRRAHRRAEHGSDLAMARLKALRDEYAARGKEPPRV